MYKTVRSIVWLMCTIISLSALSACRVADRNQILGTYALEDNEVKMTLELAKDSTYRQEVDHKTSHERETFRGTWMYNQASGDVELSGQLLVYAANGSVRKLVRHDGVALFPAERHISGIVLGSDEGELYRKRN